MKSFSHISDRFDPLPLRLAALLARIDNGKGREELYRTQAPQVLERLASRTRFDSITASSAIEDIVLDDERALQLLRGAAPGPYRDRTESEFAGYRDAVDYFLAKEAEPLSVPLVLHLHRLLMRNTEDPTAGALKANDNFVGARHGDGTRSVIFETVPAGTPTEWHLTELVARYEDAVREGIVPSLLLVAALVLDFLAVHPFEEGNGRVARLLTTNELLRHGYGVARYASTRRTRTTSRCGRASPAGTRRPTTSRRGPPTCCGSSRTPTPTSSGGSRRAPSSSARRSASRRATTSSRRRRRASGWRRSSMPCPT